MGEKKKNLSIHDSFTVHQPEEIKVGIVVSEWNETITGALKEGAIETLLAYGLKKKNIQLYSVPGSFELPSAASMLLSSDIFFNGIICLGCIIKGETRHDEYISQAVAKGIMQVGLVNITPVIFGVLTCDTMEQALDRAGGKHGNKGVEAAVSLLKMIELERSLE